MIRYFEISGLPRQSVPIKQELFGDINIITGRNGSGKTTVLKLLWYLTSGNVEHAIREVPFSRAYVRTDEYEINVIRLSAGTAKIELTVEGQKIILEDEYDPDSETMVDAESRANELTKDFSSSVFFPTFRRIEGGFSIVANASQATLYRSSARPRTDIEEALFKLSRRLTVERHAFVSSISTVDIVGLLMRNYTEMSEISNNLQRETSQEIIDQIKDYKQDSVNSSAIIADEAGVLDKIRLMIENMEHRRKETMAPLDAVRAVVERIFYHSGINLGARLSFGDAATAVSSDMLSAGEKQMLSFICYNAFYRNSVIFIDEPELSLHVDWQRQLFPTLQDQGTSNQFIVATHSPFIYGKYPDREILIGSDRGASTLEID